MSDPSSMAPVSSESSSTGVPTGLLCWAGEALLSSPRFFVALGAAPLSAARVGHTSTPVTSLRSPLRVTMLRVFLGFLLGVVFRSVEHVDITGRRRGPIPCTG